MRSLIRALTDNKINLLLAAAPASWALDEWMPGSPWIFITAAVSLVPLAGLIGLGTEQREHHVALVKASITGSIVGNLLLVLGLSFFVGRLGRRSQKFHRTAATNATAMLFLA